MTSLGLGSRDPAYVLYVDHQGHPAPLSECFHATASRRLSSTVDRVHRPSTVTQVDSAYCPQCLSFHDASSATQLGYCPKPTCLQCPLCTSIVSCNKVDAVLCFTCGRCDWNSIQCGLKVDSTAGTPTTKDDIINAVAQLSTLLQEKRQQGGHIQAVEEHYQTMIAAWEGVVKTGPKLPSAATVRSLPKRISEEVWSVESLESALQTKKETHQTNPVLGGKPLQRISLEQEQSLDPSLQGLSVESLSLQALTQVPTQSMADLLPLPVPLRSRKSRRCRAELAEGKPGILLKPKLNPLEGDSSLRTGHGQWWKKDSSAVHVVPRVRVSRHGYKVLDDTTQQHAFVLKVTNSTLGLVRLQLGLSRYKGESFWEDDIPTKNPSLEHLLVETLTDKHVDAFLLTTNSTSASTSQPSEMVELDSAEDSIVDIGKVLEVPTEVTGWDAEKVLEAAPVAVDGLEENKVEFGTVKVLAMKAGSAWFEVVCATRKKPDDGVFFAIPISLQIEVGNGSWESSLVKPTSAGDKKDMVSFDLVLAWTNK